MSIVHSHLEASFQYDFLLFGICSSAKEYKLAWAINQRCICHFKKAQDITLTECVTEELLFSHYCYQRGSQTWRLLENKTYIEKRGDAFLVPELSQWNFLLWLHDPGEHISLNWLEQNLKTIPDIKSFSQISVDLLANKENLLF